MNNTFKKLINTEIKEMKEREIGRSVGGMIDLYILDLTFDLTKK
jgi:hypothetical protein